MNKFLNIIIVVFSLIVISCGGSSDDPPPPPPVVENPTTADLVLPLKNEECNQGNIISATLSKVDFEWNKSENTDKYTLVLKNLSTNETTETNTSSTTISKNIERGTSFSWHIISISNSTSKTATSETWNFFNAGEPVENYIPFPAEVVSPPMGGLSDNIVSLKWNGSDLDHDIVKYEVYLDESNPPTTWLATATDTSLDDVTLSSNKLYYWTVKTIDNYGNSSMSPVFEFRTQ